MAKNTTVPKNKLAEEVNASETLNPNKNLQRNDLIILEQAGLSAERVDQLIKGNVDIQSLASAYGPLKADSVLSKNMEDILNKVNKIA